MNLLDATATVLDLAKTHAHERDRTAQAAIKRVEKRLLVLRIRAAKTRARNRRRAWWDCMWSYVGGFMPGVIMVIKCPKCKELVTFKDFCRQAVVTPAGRIQDFPCPHCGFGLQSRVKPHPQRCEFH